jgi:gamma-glutamyltranspeptidase / glutathione hydrolase
MIIIGAGIGGLTLGLALPRAGISCRIYEAAPAIEPIGVGVNVLPHATRELGLETALVAGEATAGDGLHKVGGRRGERELAKLVRHSGMPRSGRPGTHEHWRCLNSSCRCSWVPGSLAAPRNDSRRVSFAGLLAALVLAAAFAGEAAAASPTAVEAEHGMIVTSQHIASAVGAGILAAGGNAIDAAVAVGYALAVVEPCCGNIGGGGFMTIHLADGRDTFINFRETAPAAATGGMYLDADGQPVADLSRYGWRATGVPGTVMGLDRSLAEYGRLPRAAVMAPAIALARDGFVLSRADTELLDAKANRFAEDSAAAEIFLHPDGSPFVPGDRLVQKDLAATLAAIAKQGPDAFYSGPVAAAVDKASRAHGGILTARDFADYTVTEGPPLSCSYRGYAILSAPPPSSGGTTVCEILNILEGYDMKALGFRSARSVELMVEAMRRGYSDRNMYLGDPAVVTNPLDRLLSTGYATGIRAVIGTGEASRSVPLPAPHEKAETTHYSVVDGAGNAVAVTYTINGYFGAEVIAPGTGFFLNNEMDDFAAKPGTANLYGLVQGEANAIMPSKRPLSSMAPTLVEKKGRVFLVLGSPGGSRIITTVLETIMNIVDYGMAPQAAVDAPRLHYQGLPDKVFYERSGLSPDTAAALGGMGYKLVEQKPWGATELIQIANGRLWGASDPRRPDGAAIGY